MVFVAGYTLIVMIFIMELYDFPRSNTVRLLISTLFVILTPFAYTVVTLESEIRRCSLSCGKVNAIGVDEQCRQPEQSASVCIAYPW